MDTLYHQLQNIAGTAKISFHMPGSKAGRALPEEYLKDVFSIDFTELSETDNLAAPTGILRQAQEDIAAIYHAKESFFLVNGSSGGLLSSIGYLAAENKHILFDRNCHISLVNAMQLHGVTPYFALPELVPGTNLAGGVTAGSIEKILCQNPEIGSVVITAPNYYGLQPDIAAISAVCREKNVLLCVDAAHGAHFAFSEKLPPSAVDQGADIAVMSAHKTLPAPTQTAILHISDRINSSEMKNWVNRFQTTSPSYILMAYTHLAVQYMKENGGVLFDQLSEWIGRLSQPWFLRLPQKDFSRLLIDAASYEKTGYALAGCLKRDYSIEVEMADLCHVVCIAGPGNTQADFEQLSLGCKAFFANAERGHKAVFPAPALPETTGLPADFLNCRKAWRDLPRCEGRASASPVTVYPPGIPILLPGERISKELIHYLDTIRTAGGTILGMRDRQIEVVE